MLEYTPQQGFSPEPGDVDIAATACADRRIDGTHGAFYTPEIQPLRDAEKERLLQEYAELGDASEVGKALKQFYSR